MKKIPRGGFTPAQEPAIRYIEQNLGTSSGGGGAGSGIEGSRTFTTPTVTDPGGGSAVTNEFATSGSAILIQVTGDAFPQIYIPADAGSGIYMADGTVTPFDGGNIYWSIGDSFYFSNFESGSKVQITTSGGEIDLDTSDVTKPIKISQGNITSPGGSNSERFGLDATAVGSNSVTLGNGASSPHNDMVSIGYQATGDDDKATSIGSGSSSTGHGVALGYQAQATGPDGVAIGANATADQETVAIGGSIGGNQASAVGRKSIAIGNGASTTDANSISIGPGTGSDGDFNTLIGPGIGAGSVTSIVALGSAIDIDSGSDSCIAIGDVSNIGADAPGSIAIGAGATVAANATNAIALGNNVTALNPGDVQIGDASSLYGFYGVTPVAQAGTPTTLSDVITILTNLGFCS